MLLYLTLRSIPSGISFILPLSAVKSSNTSSASNTSSPKISIGILLQILHFLVPLRRHLPRQLPHPLNPRDGLHTLLDVFAMIFNDFIPNILFSFFLGVYEGETTPTSLTLSSWLHLAHMAVLSLCEFHTHLFF